MNRGHHAMLRVLSFLLYITILNIVHRLLYINNLPDVNGDLMIYNNPNEPYTQASCNLRTVMMISKYEGASCRC